MDALMEVDYLIAASRPRLDRRDARRRQASALAACAMCFAVGCGGDEARLLGDYLEAMDVDAPLEAATSVSLGRFDVTAPTRLKTPGPSGATVVRNVLIRVSFELFAETVPQAEAAVQAAAQLRRGALNDSLLTIIRTSSVDELSDPRLSALKLRMTEAARPLLGETKLRQLVLDDIDARIL
jgi:hypothetical protein